MRQALAGLYGIGPENLILGNGSDEILNFAFMAFCDETKPAAFPDISYGFYPVFAALNRIPYTEIPLRQDFAIAPEIARFACKEGLDGHARSALIRLEDDK